MFSGFEAPGAMMVMSDILKLLDRYMVTCSVEGVLIRNLPLPDRG